MNLTKVEKQNQISFRYSRDSETDYILTLDGREIGRVYELELAQMIEEIASRREVTTLENKCEELERAIENQKQDLIELQALYHQSKIKLKKIHKLTTEEHITL